MKKIATITNEDGLDICISFDGQQLFAESFGEPTYQIGCSFASEQEAAEYIQDSYSSGWSLTWEAVAA